MAKGVSISVASDTKEFLTGIKNGVIEPLEDASDVLKDLGRDGEKTGDKLEDAMRDAQRDTEKLAKEYDLLGDKIRESSRRGGNALKANTKEATSQAAQDLGELKDEALQNASETFSSFDGSFDSLVDGIQGTLGGIVSNIGPVGAIAGAAAAVGLGLITAELQKSAERAAEIREQTSELTKEIIDAGGSIDKVAIADKVRDWSLEIADNKEWWELWQESALTNLDKVREVADKTGYGLQDVFDAMSGQDTSGALDMLDDMEDRLGEVNDAYQDLARAKLGGTDRAVELKREKDALEDATTAIRDRLDMNDQAIEDARTITALQDQQIAREEALAQAEETRADAMDALQGELDEGISSWNEYIDKETGAVDPAAYLAGMQARMDATANFNGNVQLMAEKFKLSDEEIQVLLDQGIDFAPMLQSIIDSGMGEQYATQIRAMLDGGQAILDGEPTTANVTTATDTSEAESKLDKAAEERVSDVEQKPDTRKAVAALDRAAKDRTTMIRAFADVSRAEWALNAFVNRTRVATVRVETIDREGRPVSP